MTKIETKTKTGVKVDLILEGMLCKAIAHHPTLGDIEGNCTWEEIKPDVEGLKMYAKVNGKYGHVCLAVPKADYQPIEDAIAKAKADKRQARLDLEASQPNFRMLVASGSYYMDTDIASVCVDPDQSGYADWCKGKIVMGLMESEPIKIEKKDSPTAQAIMDKKSSGWMYGSGESAMWEITAEQEAQIIAECKASKLAREEKKASEKQAKQDKVDAIFETAMKTGKKQVVRTWITEDCMNGSIECSFDQATRWAMPDGTFKTTYVCCH